MTQATESSPVVTPLSITKATDFAILRRCFSYVRPYWRTVAGTYVAMVVITVLALLTPQFIRWIVDHGIRAENRQLLGWSVVALLGLTLMKGITTFLQGRWSEVASQGVAYDLRNAIYEKLAALSFAYHDRTETGQLLSRAIQDVDRVRFLTGRAVLRLIESAALALGTFFVLLWMNPVLALLSMAALPLLVHRGYEFGRRLRPFSLAVQQQLAVLTTRLEQNLRGARVVKAFAQEEAETERFGNENQQWFDLSLQATRLQAVNNPLMDLIANFGTVFIIWYGGLQVIQGQLTLGELVAFTTYLAQLMQPVRRLGLIIPAISMAATAGERIFEILDTPSAVADAPDAYPLPPVTGHVRFEDVGFSYFGHHWVLRHINLEATPGQVIALLGATGSGKSSIINLIPRFYDPTEGRVLIDGHDLRRVTLASLRDQIGIVLQETTLFAATIRENIAFGQPGATEEEIIAAAKAAQAHDFIQAMPNGYETEVGERGVTLSGGQKQRVAIARALLKDPRILILDDATSSVDTATERLIQAALARLLEGRTAFVIAQRLSTVRLANLIVVLEKGRIAAMGRHEDLLQTSELYARIYHDQLRPQERAGGGELPQVRVYPQPAPGD
ncbi:MAG: ABC transporter ATP-binding protein [Chloroflexi bacterium]|nr:MAG: ABC transporter ATP-binding protein [Chloroflexota bacterium]